MPNERELSEKLESLAYKLDEIADSDLPNWFTEIREIASELRKLSKENYAPGNGLSWGDVKPNSTKKTYTDKKTGKKLPF